MITGEIGQIVRHKLMGKAVITGIPKPLSKGHDPLWEIRMANGGIMMVHKEELEELDSREEKLKKWLAGAKNIIKLVEMEMKEGDKHEHV